MLLCSVYLGEPPISDFFSKKSEKVLAQPSRFPYSTSSLQGGVAQLGERLTGSQEVRGSIPLVSTTCFFLSLHGGVAQLGERLTGSQEVRGSIPLVSTMRFKASGKPEAFYIYACAATSHNGLLAQRLAQGTHNPWVLGSNPGGPTIKTAGQTTCLAFFFLALGVQRCAR